MTLSQWLHWVDLPPDAFAARLGVPSKAIRDWVRGLSVPPVDVRVIVANLTDGAVTLRDWGRP